MKKEELVALREQILSDIVPLVLDSADDGADRFALLLRIIQAGNANGDVYKRAYASAKAIEDSNDRLSALLSLIDEIDFDTQDKAEVVPVVEEVTAAEQPFPENPPTEPQHHDQ